MNLFHPCPLALSIQNYGPKGNRNASKSLLHALVFPCICTVTFILVGCKKNIDGPRGGPGDAQTQTPTASPIITNIGVYVYNNDQGVNPLEVLSYENYGSAIFSYQPDYEEFSTSNIRIDQYLSHIAYGTSVIFNDNNSTINQFKGFSASSESKNYVGLKNLDYVNTGVVKNLGGSMTLQLPGSGELIFPAEAFSSVGLDIDYSIFVNYLDPSATDFAVSLPSLPFADENQRRSFLESYGVFQIRPILSYCNCNVLYSPPDLITKEVELEMPIPASRLVNAPDSIEAWHLDPVALTWVKSGMAYKKNGFYEKKITQLGVWNLAKTIDAAYVTLQLRTTNDMGLPNTRFVVKDINGEVAEGRTDMEGNALIFVPANEDLKLNIIDDHFYNYLNIQTPDWDLGSFSQATSKKIVMQDRVDIGTLDASVYYCDGTSFGNGSVLIYQTGAKDVYSVPIVHGKFRTANWLRDNFGDAILSFYDSSGNNAFDCKTYLGSEYITHVKRLNENFYGCLNAPFLYCNYDIDGQASQINGDINQSAPTLTAKPMQGYVQVTMQDGSKGISFGISWPEVPDGRFGEVPLFVNNLQCSYGDNPEITLYRNDNVVDGFMEGWFIINYLDGANNLHKLTGNFRVKIIN